MIIAFDVIHAGGLSDPSRVAGGISQALYTTAWGLIVAAIALAVP
jgi:biopolymer transport protein ExbB/TolQ